MSSLHEEDPFYDGKSHLPSGKEFTPNPKRLTEKTGREGKRKPSEIKAIFNAKTRKFWEDQGYRVDRLEGWQNINGAYVQKDFVGSFDMIATKPGEVPILIQVSSKQDERKHWGKMLSDKLHDGKEERRTAVLYFYGMGWKVVINWWHQPGGFRNKWEGGCTELTDELIASIDNGRRTRKVAA